MTTDVVHVELSACRVTDDDVDKRDRPLASNEVNAAEVALVDILTELV